MVFVRQLVLNGCRRWAAAAAQARPSRLCIERNRYTAEYLLHTDIAAYKDGIGEMRWLQTCKRQGQLELVRDFVMREQFPWPSELKTLYTPFAQNMLTYAGLWNLQKCDLHGPFCLVTAVGTLPTTITSLSLHPFIGPPFALSAFHRFKSLESLSLAYDLDEGSPSYSPVSPVPECDYMGLTEISTSFTLDCILNSVHILDLLGSDNLLCGFAPWASYNLVQCLPNLTNLRARVNANMAGVDVACDAAALPCLQELFLVLGPSFRGLHIPDHHVLLNADPKLVVASQIPIKQLYSMFTQRNISYCVES